MTDVLVEKEALVLVEASDGGVLLEQPARAIEIVTEGLQGPPGPVGAQGADGQPGATGLRVVGAVAEFSELPVSADAGDVWVTRTTGFGFAWNGTEWVDIGPIAIQGPTGKHGQIRYTGTGAPTLIVGAEPGDTYLDVSTGTIYKLT